MIVKVRYIVYEVEVYCTQMPEEQVTESKVMVMDIELS
jgi:hypothetical protein